MRFTRLVASLTLSLLSFPAIADPMAASQRARSGDFDRRGDLFCAQNAGDALATCKAAVAHVQNSAAIVVTFPSGFRRMLTFTDGRFVRGNATMSGVGTDSDWRLDDGTYRIRVDDQRFEIPQSMIRSDMAAPTE
ncbi:hypothetical protein [Nitratireductor basaltis]|uniref:Uncharacterized protein n=1 Tax=Nitratireductor basaltis TaxID=472175 RepID=A0A084UA51_9HYPH|nr:hypothetical protein [Nitratireductor basaltis]KFB09837.1 hypothetical protein EL18_00856 [Nitratireductor basaltis]